MLKKMMAEELVTDQLDKKDGEKYSHNRLEN